MDSGACSSHSTHRPGIAVPPGTVQSSYLSNDNLQLSLSLSCVSAGAFHFFFTSGVLNSRILFSQVHFQIPEFNFEFPEAGKMPEFWTDLSWKAPPRPLSHVHEPWEAALPLTYPRHTYLAGAIPWSTRWFTLGEAHPLHIRICWPEWIWQTFKSQLHNLW